MKKNELIRLSGVAKSFDNDVILKSLNLSVNDGEFVTLLGPSGCGKTTTLRIIGGFEKPDAGDVFFASQRINDVPPNKRNINTVFQKYALFPHLNVAENIAFGLNIRKVDKKEVARRVEEMLELVNLKGFGRRSVASLSGGQQQRVAIARAVIQQPKVLLLDEPLGALDLKLRKEMQVELKNLHETLNMTFIYVTHDQEEALTMSDTVVVMNQGEILQQGTPIDIYNEPANAFVAVDRGFEKNEPVDLVIRPEDIVLLEKSSGSIQQADRLLKGRVQTCLFKGVHYEMLVETEGFTFMVHSTVACPVGADKYLDVDPDNIHIMKKSDIATVTELEHMREQDPTDPDEEQ